MPEADLLTIIAEIALGIAGFSGVIVAIGPKRKKWQRLDKVRIGALLINVFLVLIFALIPLGFHSAGLAPADIWFYSGVLYLITLIHIPFRTNLTMESAQDYDGFKSYGIGYAIIVSEAVAAGLLLFNVLDIREA